MQNLKSNYSFKLDFQKVDQHTGGMWLFHGTKRRKDNQLQSLELPCMISQYKHDIKESEGNMYNPIYKENVRRRKHPGSCTFAEQVTETMINTLNPNILNGHRRWDGGSNIALSYSAIAI